MAKSRQKVEPFVINSADALSKAKALLQSTFDEHKYVRMTLRLGKDRSLDINALSHVWYEQVSRELNEDLPIQVKAFCKLTYGVPILLAQDRQFQAFYAHTIEPLTYEQQLWIMEKDFCPVTSRMTTTQMKQYMDDVQAAYADRVRLEYPPDDTK